MGQSPEGVVKVRRRHAVISRMLVHSTEMSQGCISEPHIAWPIQAPGITLNINPGRAGHQESSEKGARPGQTASYHNRTSATSPDKTRHKNNMAKHGQHLVSVPRLLLGCSTSPSHDRGWWRGSYAHMCRLQQRGSYLELLLGICGAPGGFWEGVDHGLCGVTVQPLQMLCVNFDNSSRLMGRSCVVC